MSRVPKSIIPLVLLAILHKPLMQPQARASYPCPPILMQKISRFYTRARRGSQEQMEDRQRGKVLEKKKWYLLLFTLLLLSVLGSGVAVVGTYSASYQRYMPLAQAGVQHLRKAATLLAALPQNPFDARAVGQARDEFTAALTSFSEV